MENFRNGTLVKCGPAIHVDSTKHFAAFLRELRFPFVVILDPGGVAARNHALVNVPP